MNASKIDLRRDPVRSVKARAAAARSTREKAVSAYVGITPTVLRKRAASMSLSRIADDLNAAGHRTRKGADFTGSTVARIIARAEIPAE